MPTHAHTHVDTPTHCITCASWLQVGLSAYMAFAAANAAREAGYGIICNEFNSQETRITSVVWLFYMSKVRLPCVLSCLKRIVNV